MANNTLFNRTDDNHTRRRGAADETKPAFMSRRLLIAYIVVALGILVASAMVDQDRGVELGLGDELGGGCASRSSPSG